MIKSLLDPHFKLNGEVFSSAKALKDRARFLLENEKEDEIAIGHFILEWLDEKDFIVVKTSGSTGNPKLIKLQKKNVLNSAAASIAHFKLHRETKALLCLSAEYIAGKMMLVRAMTGGWDLYTATPGKNPLHSYDGSFDFSAMVPYQLHHSLEELYKVKKIIIGGGAVPKELEAKLQPLQTEVFATYGMTETISHIAVRALNGPERSNEYRALPGIEFSQAENNCLQIWAPAISEEMVTTNDVVNLSSSTSFLLLGRIDNVINSGGVKIHPEIVEQKLSAHIATPFFISSENDEILGERVVLVVETSSRPEYMEYREIFNTLPPYERPKSLLVTSHFIYTGTGKIQRAATLKKIEGRNP